MLLEFFVLGDQAEKNYAENFICYPFVRIFALDDQAKFLLGIR
jgi:hypothetical protein